MRPLDPRAPRFPVDLVQRLVPYVFCAPRVTGKRVLDVSGGTGAGPRHLAETAKEVHAYLASAEDAAREGARHAAANLSYRVRGSDPGPEGRAYGAACAFLVMERWKRRHRKLVELCAALDGSGELFLTVQNRRTVHRAGLVDRSSMEAAELVRTMEAVFSRVEVLGIHSSGRVRTFWERRRTALAAATRRDPLRLLPPALRPGGVSRLQERVRADLLRAGASSLSIGPDDFEVREEGVEDADHLLAIATGPR